MQGHEAVTDGIRLAKPPKTGNNAPVLSDNSTPFPNRY